MAPPPIVRPWPNTPLAGATLQNVIPSYLYQQYSDDDTLAAFVVAFNEIAQTYLDWFNNVSLPVYTGLSGDLLDWVGQGIYGMPRPVLIAAGSNGTGAIDTMMVNAMAVNSFKPGSSSAYYLTSDDVYKRVLTWHFYKGDGKQFTIRWLKRRIMRFCFGVNGSDYIIDTSYNVSVTFPTNAQANIAISNAGYMGTVFKQAVQQGVLELPFQFSFNITLS